MTKTKCARTACENTLDRGFWRIWNLGVSKALAVDSYFRQYCPSCGRKIIDFNRQELKAGVTWIKLDYERVDSCGTVMEEIADTLS